MKSMEHKAEITEYVTLETNRLFKNCMSFEICKEKAFWPSLSTVNSFMQNGIDDCFSGTFIKWDPCNLNDSDYKNAIEFCMSGKKYTIDSKDSHWKEWFNELVDR